jgi:hypothetical protein
VTSLNVTVLNLLNTHLNCIALLISNIGKIKEMGITIFFWGHFDDSLLAMHCTFKPDALRTNVSFRVNHINYSSEIKVLIPHCITYISLNTGHSPEKK